LKTTSRIHAASSCERREVGGTPRRLDVTLEDVTDAGSRNVFRAQGVADAGIRDGVSQCEPRYFE
jgi:hypothetical protein